MTREEQIAALQDEIYESLKQWQSFTAGQLSVTANLIATLMVDQASLMARVSDLENRLQNPNP